MELNESIVCSDAREIWNHIDHKTIYLDHHEKRTTLWVLQKVRECVGAPGIYGDTTSRLLHSLKKKTLRWVSNYAEKCR